MGFKSHLESMIESFRTRFLTVAIKDWADNALRTISLLEVEENDINEEYEDWGSWNRSCFDAFDNIKYNDDDNTYRCKPSNRGDDNWNEECPSTLLLLKQSSSYKVDNTEELVNNLVPVEEGLNRLDVLL